MRPALALGAALLLAAPALAEAPADRTPTITVTGEGDAAGTPDMATLTLGVETRGESAEAALDDNNAAMAATLEALREAGIAPRDLQTSGLSVMPVYEPRQRGDSEGDREVDFFRVVNQATVRVRDLDALGGILDRVVGVGANRLGGLFFGFSDASTLEAQARTAATREARRAAEAYAAGLGLALGRVLSIQAGGGVRPMPADMRTMAMEAAPVPVAPGERTISASATVVFELVDE